VEREREERGNQNIPEFLNDYSVVIGYEWLVSIMWN
jgi:hypothetical protein